MAKSGSTQLAMNAARSEENSLQFEPVASTRKSTSIGTDVRHGSISIEYPHDASHSTSRV